MAGLSEYLREHRESAGRTLEEISAETRISVLQLRALEDEHFEELPGGVFNVSFLRQFARAIGADEDEAVSRYKAVHSVAPKLPYDDDARRDPYLEPGPTGRLAASAGGFFQEHGSTILTVAVGVLLLVGGGYSFEAWQQKRAEDLVAAEQQAEAEAAAQQAAVEEARRRSEQAAAAKEAALKAQQPAAPIDLKLHIVETVWIRASADGERVLDGTFREGVKPILAQEEVTLRVGNAGGVRLTLNGEAAPPIGPRGHVRSVRITPEGVEVIGGTPVPAAPVQAPPTTAASARDAELAANRTGR